MFYPGSRYQDIPDAEFIDEEGRIRPYKKIRFIPKTEGQFRHIVTDGERPDHLAFRYYKDAERFWRLCDANELLWSSDLTAQPGKTVDIPHSA